MLAVIIGEGIVLFKIIDLGKDDHSIGVEIADGESGKVSFEHLNLVPGDEVAYTLLVSSIEGPTYAVDFESLLKALCNTVNHVLDKRTCKTVNRSVKLVV